mgnify:CR=1 FL=1
MEMNKTIIIGRVITAIQLQEDSSDSIARFTIASSREFNGESSTVDFEIVVKGKQAIAAYKHIRRGDLCCVEGKLTSIDRRVAIEAERLTFLSNKK